MNRPSSGLWLVLIGAFLSAAGVLFDFVLQLHSFHMSVDDKEFFFLQNTFLPILLLGLLATLAGSVIWAWRRASISALTMFGAVIAALTLLAAKLTPINVHDWTWSLMSVYLVSLLIGTLFLVFAAVRAALLKLASK